MNREIKFKAKRVDNLEWVYGFLCKEDDKYYITENTDQFYQIIPKTISQYTNLKDKNGKKIFENDIVQATSTFGLSDEDVDGIVVIDMFYGLKLNIGENKDEDNLIHFDYLEELEVIGNKFDEEVKDNE